MLLKGLLFSHWLLEDGLKGFLSTTLSASWFVFYWFFAGQLWPKCLMKWLWQSMTRKSKWKCRTKDRRCYDWWSIIVWDHSLRSLFVLVGISLEYVTLWLVKRQLTDAQLDNQSYSIIFVFNHWVKTITLRDEIWAFVWSVIESFL